MVPELHGRDGGVIGGLVADHGAAAVTGGGAGGAPGLDAALPEGNSRSIEKLREGSLTALVEICCTHLILGLSIISVRPMTPSLRDAVRSLASPSSCSRCRLSDTWLPRREGAADIRLSTSV